MPSVGPTVAGAGADDATVGTVSWSNPSRVTASDDSRATATLASMDVSHYLVASSFGFAILAGSTINGIQVEWERSWAMAAGVQIADSSVRLWVGGAAAGNDKSAGAVWSSLGDAWNSFGGAADTWGLTPTAAQVNGSDFGAVLSATNTALGGTGDALVDACRITATYTPPQGLPRRQFREVGRLAETPRLESDL